MAPLDSPAQRSVLEPQMSPLSLRMFCFALFVRKEKKKKTQNSGVLVYCPLGFFF